MRLLSSTVRSVYKVALATIAGAGLYGTTLAAYSVCNLCECHTGHNNCAEDHVGLCGDVGDECFLHEGTPCEYSDIEMS
jgi:hypothetical protein